MTSEHGSLQSPFCSGRFHHTVHLLINNVRKEGIFNNFHYLLLQTFVFTYILIAQSGA